MLAIHLKYLIIYVSVAISLNPGLSISSSTLIRTLQGHLTVLIVLRLLSTHRSLIEQFFPICNFFNLIATYG